MSEPWLGAGIAAVAGWLVALLALRAWWRTRRRLRQADSAKRSQSTRYGQLTEQFAPWMEGWPFDPRGFRFLGQPIDGVQVTDDALYFVEIKSATARLSAEQVRLRELVTAGRVGWVEFRIDDAGGGADVVEPWRARGLQGRWR